jgi:CO dehydrogenase/acetyl-CoA synthase beta subunit
MKLDIKNGRIKEKAKNDFKRQMEEIKPFLRKKGHPIYSTTKEWEIANSDI